MKVASEMISSATSKNGTLNGSFTQFSPEKKTCQRVPKQRTKEGEPVKPCESRSELWGQWECLHVPLLWAIFSSFQSHHLWSTWDEKKWYWMHARHLLTPSIPKQRNCPSGTRITVTGHLLPKKNPKSSTHFVSSEIQFESLLKFVGSFMPFDTRSYQACNETVFWWFLSSWLCPRWVRRKNGVFLTTVFYPGRGPGKRYKDA